MAERRARASRSTPAAAALRRRARRGRGRRAHRRRRPQPRPTSTGHVDVDGAPAALEALAYDPQTSGGLLAAVDPAPWATLEATASSTVGTVEVGGPGVSCADVTVVAAAIATVPAAAQGDQGEVAVAARSSARCGPTGHEVVVGMDEVGRGSWAGPLSVGAAVLPAGPARLQDPRLEDAHRARARSDVRSHRRLVRGMGGRARRHRTSATTLGMSAAQRLAAKRALEGLGVPVDQVLLDGKWDFVGRGTTINAGEGRRRGACRSRRRRSSPRSPATASCGPRPSTTRATTSS